MSVELQPAHDFQLSLAGLSRRALAHTSQQINFISAVKLSTRRKQSEWQPLSPAPALSHSPVTGQEEEEGAWLEDCLQLVVKVLHLGFKPTAAALFSSERYNGR